MLIACNPKCVQNKDILKKPKESTFVPKVNYSGTYKEPRRGAIIIACIISVLIKPRRGDIV